MTPDQLRNAIAKGLGRVIQHLRSDGAGPYIDIIKDACVHWRGYDIQVEDPRGPYLLEIIQLSGHEAELANDVLRGLRESQNVDDVWQAFDLARHLAEHGHPEVSAAIRDRFGNVPEFPDLGAEEIIALDRDEGLLHVARHLGQRVLAGERYAADAWLLSVADEYLGEGSRERLLEPAANSEPLIRACLESIDKDIQRDTEWRNRPPRLRRWAGMTYDQVKRRLDHAHGKVGMIARYWGKDAPESDILAAARDLLAETRPEFLRAYLRMFFDRPFPLELDRLIEIAESAEYQLSNAAFRALAAIESPRVRAFGEDLLRRGHHLRNAFDLFELNHYEDDHSLWAEALARNTFDRDAAHGATLALLTIYESHPPEPAGKAVLEWIYENTPCAHCRGRAVALLISSGVASEQILRECLDDCNAETRALAREALGA